MADEPSGDGPAEMEDADESIGYRNPPKKTRFRPQQSGNPRGRPRGARGRKKIVQEVAAERHAITEQGRRRGVSTLELALLQLRNLAAKGDVRAFRALHQLAARYDPEQEAVRGSYRVVPARLTIEEWIAEYGSQAADQPAEAGETNPGAST